MVPISSRDRRTCDYFSDGLFTRDGTEIIVCSCEHSGVGKVCRLS